MSGIDYARFYTGTLGNVANIVVYTAIGDIAITSVVFTNTGGAAATVNFKLDPANGGNDKFLLPVAVSLEAGYSLVFDGQRFMVMNPSGMIVQSVAVSDLAYGAGWNGITDTAASKNAIYDQMELRAPKASPTFTGVVTAPTIDLTGGQIAFPAIQDPSAGVNTLDDYEEGDHVATIVCATSGNYVIDAAGNTLAYTKVGRVCHLQGYLNITGENAPNGQLLLSLPFTSVALTENADVVYSNCYIRNHGDAGIENSLWYVPAGSNVAYLSNITDAGAYEAIDEARVDAAFFLYVCITYMTE